MHFFRFHMKYGHKVSPSPFIMHLISYEIISQMKCFLPIAFEEASPCTSGQGGGWALDRIPSASKPPGGASTCTWYSQPGTLYFLRTFHMKILTLCTSHAFQFHMKYMVSQAPFIFPHIPYDILF